MAEAQPGSVAELSPQHERIIDAAERCFDRWGAAKTSIDDVANEAGLSRATVYRYFGNRSELITAVGIRAWDRASREWHATVANRLPGRERVVSALLWSRDWVLSFAEPSLAQALSESENFRVYSHDWYVALLADMLDAGELEGDIDVEGLAAWVVYIRNAIWTDTTSSHDELRAMLTRYLLPTVEGVQTAVAGSSRRKYSARRKQRARPKQSARR
jgi:AcrR family transcriptional regulator